MNEARSCALLVACAVVGTDAGAQLPHAAGPPVLQKPVGNPVSPVTGVAPKPASVSSIGPAVPALRVEPTAYGVMAGPKVLAPGVIRMDPIGPAISLKSPRSLPQIELHGASIPLIQPTDVSLSTNLGSKAFPLVHAQLSATPAVLGPAKLLEQRQLRHRRLLRVHSRELESDGTGLPVRRGMLVVLDPDVQSLQRVVNAGFRLAGVERHAELGIDVAHVALPAHLTAAQGMIELRRLAPQLQADFDHIFEPAGGKLMPAPRAALAAGGKVDGHERIGMIDGGVAPHPALVGSAIEQRGFAGPPRATAHGTAVASLLIGHRGVFHGGACGASLFVADIYGGNRAAGSASALLRALAWLVSKQPQVINISLVGPPNRVLRRAIRAVQSGGIHVVAPVGNDGPAAPPQYPASYPGVVAVTGVDVHGKALLEAGRAAHLDFAAPGADMAAAVPGHRYARVRGTSFAAPLVSSRLAKARSLQRLAAEARPGQGRVGRGIVCYTCRVEPRAVRATATLSR